MQNIISLIFRYFLSLFPACAGVIPHAVISNPRISTFPRMRGGDPGRDFILLFENSFSPHARG